jgi:hypothetical protein
MAADDADHFKQKLNQSGRNKDIGGKTSVSKRHMRKPVKSGEDDAEIASD